MLLATMTACRRLTLKDVARRFGMTEADAYWLYVGDAARAFVTWLERKLPPEALARFRPPDDIEADAAAAVAKTPSAPQKTASETPPIEPQKTFDEVLRELGYGRGSTERTVD